jgi:hypothetical protein
MIDPDHYGLVEMAFTGAVVLGFLFWQLWTVRHVKLGSPKDKAPDEKAPRD